MTDTEQQITDIEARLMKLGWKPRAIAARLAHAAGVNATTYRRWRNGETEPNVATWRRITDELDKLGGMNGREHRATHVASARGRIDQASRGRRKDRKTDRGASRRKIAKRRNRPT